MRMRIWKLAPTDLSDPRWEDWNPEPIFVRAESEAEARRLTKFKTVKGFTLRPGESLPLNPWGGHKRIEEPAFPTICEDVTDQPHGYSVEGPVEVLNRDRG